MYVEIPRIIENYYITYPKKNKMDKGRKIGFTIQDASTLHESKKHIHKLIFSKVQKKFANNKKAMPLQESLID
jgi:hypothetical protein